MAFTPLQCKSGAPIDNEFVAPLKSTGVTPEIYNTLVENLDLSARTLNCLKRANLNRVGDVIAVPRSELLKIRNFGQRSITELFEKLEGHGVTAEGSEKKSEDEN